MNYSLHTHCLIKEKQNKSDAMWFLRPSHKKDMASAWLSPLGCLPLELVLYVARKSRPHGVATRRYSRPKPK